MPDYGISFTEQLTQEVRKDFLALGPIYRLFRGYYEDTVNDDR